jgi:5'-3' exonuclease
VHTYIVIMGIPSYFSYIIKNHMKILQRFGQTPMAVHNLYLDSNSVIYDAIRELQKAGEIRSNIADNYKPISALVCKKIQEYIDAVRPSNTVYIAFDGVAPLAKMNQQKTRRYRSVFMEKHKIVSKAAFNSCLITPGTDFMEYLSEYTTTHYKKNARVIVSAANKPGEGEHKLFQHIRDNKESHKGQNTVIYGLDADLLMLSIFHNEYTNLYVYREAPEFAKSLNADLENGEAYLLDITALCRSVCSEMDCRHNHPRRVYDYAFLCFMLGNDFLPHLPALNIRTHGIFTLLDAYKDTLGNSVNAYIIGDDGSIQWAQFKKVIQHLAKQEETLFQTEYKKRGEIRFSTSFTNDAEKEAVFNNTPLLYRQTEHYINPLERGWRQRYYNALFHGPLETETICENYMEGLEWVYKYYTDECVDWRWKYNYHYQPLLADLMKTPLKPSFFTNKKTILTPFHPKTQLSYVLPPEYLDVVLPGITAKYTEYYQFDGEFEWAFCRYFWEAHLKMTDIPTAHLDMLDAQW